MAGDRGGVCGSSRAVWRRTTTLLWIVRRIWEIVDVRGIGFAYQVRRVVAVDDARHERVVFRERTWRGGRLVVRDWFRPPFREHQRADLVSDVVLKAGNEASQIDAVDLVNRSQPQDFDTHSYHNYCGYIGLGTSYAK